MANKASRLIAAFLTIALLAACAPSERVDMPGPVDAGPALPAYDPSATPDPLAPSQRPAAPTPIPPVATATPLPVPENGPVRLSVLLMGVDERETWTEGPPRTDALMLLSLDTATHTAVLVSIPRDLWVNIPAFGQERINVAYRVAEMSDPGTGASKASETVAELLGVPVDRYAVVNFRAVREIIDSLGGLEVEVAREIWDYQFPSDDNQFMTVHFEAGRQVLDGERALQYIRTRHDSSDFERMRRQQQVVQAARERVMRPDFVTKIPGLLLVARDCIRTNLTVSEMLSLWRAFRDTPAGAVQLAAIDETLSYPWITTAGAEVLIPDEQGIAELVASLGLRQDSPPAELAQGLQVRLYASSGDDPRFASATEVLAGAGFTVWQGGVLENGAGHTLVLDYTNGERGPEIARALGLESIQVLNVPRPPNLPENLAADILLWSAARAAG